MKYQWEICHNPQVMILHVDIRLPRVFSGFDFESETNRLDEEDASFIKSLRSVVGVESISTGNHQCQIRIGRLFDWAVIMPEIVELFRIRFAPNSEATYVNNDCCEKAICDPQS